MSDFQAITGGVQHDARAPVSADQETILGDGTTVSPLRVGTSSSFEAWFLNPLEDPSGPRLGNPVVAVDDPPETGIVSVRTGAAGLGDPQLPQVIALITQCGDAGTSEVAVRVQSSGFVVLTADQWDLITDESGGLSPGLPYYLDWALDSFGHLTSTPPSTPGMAFVQIGVAMDPVTLLISLPATVSILT